VKNKGEVKNSGEVLIYSCTDLSNLPAPYFSLDASCAHQVWG